MITSRVVHFEKRWRRSDENSIVLGIDDVGDHGPQFAGFEGLWNNRVVTLYKSTF